MRVLFTTSPGLGHVFPTVRTAQAFQVAGHEVLYALGGYVEATATAGMAVVDTAPGVDFVDIFRRFVGKDQQLIVNSGDMRTPAQLFARISEVTVAGTVAVAAEWKPDVVVHSSLQGSGQLVASYCEVPAVEHGIGLGPAGMFGQVLREEMRGILRPVRDQPGTSGHGSLGGGAREHDPRAGTTLTTLDAGIPQLVLPHGADQYINAEAVRTRGGGTHTRGRPRQRPGLDRYRHHRAASHRHRSQNRSHRGPRGDGGHPRPLRRDPPNRRSRAAPSTRW